MILPQRGPTGWRAAIDNIFYETSQNPPLNVRFEVENTVLILRRAVLEKVTFVSNAVPLPRDVKFCKEAAEDDKEPGHNPLAAVINRFSWLREWATFQNSKPGYFSWIQKQGWEYDPTAPNNQFAKPQYLPTKERLYKAYLRTICADALVLDGDHVRFPRV
jgi:hypothetical protein